MNSQPTIADLLEKLESALPPLTDEDRRLAQTCVRLLADGEPVKVQRLAGALGRPEAEVYKDLAKLPWVYRDDQDRVIGYGGALLIETPHRLRVDDRQLYAMCAGDALILPLSFESDVSVESTCPTTKERITLTVSSAGVRNVSPAGAVMSYPLPGEEGYSFSGDLASRMCNFSHFFASEAAAKHWISEHQGAFQLSIENGFMLAQWWAVYLFGIGNASTRDAEVVY